jgi:hypothetical protein
VECQPLNFNIHGSNVPLNQTHYSYFRIRRKGGLGEGELESVDRTAKFSNKLRLPGSLKANVVCPSDCMLLGGMDAEEVEAPATPFQGIGSTPFVRKVLIMSLEFVLPMTLNGSTSLLWSFER